MRIHDLSEREFGIGYPIKSLVFGEFDYQGHKLCYFNDTKASYMVRFTPANQDELAFLAGCKVEDMPDVLQHWNKYEPYVGNHILNRIDPLEWMIENPWLELNTKIQIHLSKRAFNNLKKLEKPIITLNSAVIDAPWKKERE